MLQRPIVDRQATIISEDLERTVYGDATTDVQTLIPMPSDLILCGKRGSSKFPLLVRPTVTTVNLDGSTIEGFATPNIEALVAISANFAGLVQNAIVIRANMAGLNLCHRGFATTNIQDLPSKPVIVTAFALLEVFPSMTPQSYNK